MSKHVKCFVVILLIVIFYGIYGVSENNIFYIDQFTFASNFTEFDTNVFSNESSQNQVAEMESLSANNTLNETYVFQSPINEDIDQELLSDELIASVDNPELNEDNINNTESSSLPLTETSESPTASGLSTETESNSPVDITLQAVDPDSAPNDLTYSIIQNPSAGSVSEIDPTGLVTYTPNQNFSGPDSFTFQVTDETGNSSDEAVVEINVLESTTPSMGQDIGTISNTNETNMGSNIFTNTTTRSIENSSTFADSNSTNLTGNEGNANLGIQSITPNANGVMAIQDKFNQLKAAGFDIVPDNNVFDPKVSKNGKGYYQLFNDGTFGIWWFENTGANEVYGDILIRWNELNNELGPMGVPTTGELSTPDNIGRFNEFEYGFIYWKPDLGAHEIYGDIGKKFKELGWNFLGYPITGELPTPFVYNIAGEKGRYSEFEKGSVFWSAKTGAHVVYGDILKEYLKYTNKEFGYNSLGLPLTDELDLPGVSGGRYTQFENGFLVWSPTKGIFKVSSIEEGKSILSLTYYIYLDKFQVIATKAGSDDTAYLGMAIDDGILTVDGIYKKGKYYGDVDDNVPGKPFDYKFGEGKFVNFASKAPVRIAFVIANIGNPDAVPFFGPIPGTNSKNLAETAQVLLSYRGNCATDVVPTGVGPLVKCSKNQYNKIASNIFSGKFDGESPLSHGSNGIIAADVIEIPKSQLLSIANNGGIWEDYYGDNDKKTGHHYVVHIAVRAAPPVA